MKKKILKLFCGSLVFFGLNGNLNAYTNYSASNLTNLVKATVNNAQYSAYKLGGSHFDFSRGIYVLDCSRYIDYLLKAIHPKSFASLVNFSGSSAPSTRDYFYFFKNIPENSTRWNKVKAVKQLQPGDILVFRSTNKRIAVPGHVMVVMNTPVKKTGTFAVRVADSAPYRHSNDTRLPHITGIGIGTLLIKANPKTGQPQAYAWSLGSRWKKNVNFAMARPLAPPKTL